MTLPPHSVRRYTLREVALHCESTGDCWIVVAGQVLDMTSFLPQHPGGARALRHLAGTDATQEFREIHWPEADYAPLLKRFRIGVIENLSRKRMLAARPLPDTIPVPLEQFRLRQLDTPFPAERFHGTGLEAFRFEWGVLDQLLARDGPDTDPRKPLGRWATRQKSKVAPLGANSWLSIGDPEKYAAEMNFRRTLLSSTEGRAMTYVSNRNDTNCLRAQTEVLEMLLTWLPKKYPGRFRLDKETGTINTTTPGYRHSFKISDFRSEPLRLCGMLVQEDLYLMQEGDASHNVDLKLDTKDPLQYHADTTQHREDHPSGKHHVLVSAVSCFSFDATLKHNRHMGSIHHAYVPGFYMHLQKAMNRLFTHMQPGEAWWRHNYSFTTLSSVTNCVDHDAKWAHLVIPPERRANLDGESSDTGTGTGAGDAGSIDQKAICDGGTEFVRDNLQLRAEFQTLQRLPQSGQILFTVKTFIDPLANLHTAPAAAQALAAAMRRKYKGMVYYQGIELPKSQQTILGYLDSVAHSAGLTARPLIPEPWERPAMVDGTAVWEKEQALLARSAKL